MRPVRPWAREILYVWFEILGPADWFGGSNRVDAMLRARFARSLAMMRHRHASDFLDDPVTALAAVLLFDQVPRNLYRDDPRAFACDPLARAIARAAIARRWDRSLDRNGRQFLGMPLMHSERIADQRAGLAYFARHRLWETLRFSRAHHRMIARFGRFPHRNHVLGRSSTAAEKRAVAAGFAW